MRILFGLLIAGNLILAGCKGRLDKPWLTPRQREAEKTAGFGDRHIWYSGPEGEAELKARRDWERTHPPQDIYDRAMRMRSP